MRPFSLSAYAARIIWDGAPALVWLGLGGLLYFLAAHFLQTTLEFTLPLAAFLLWMTMRLLRPLRKSFNLTAYSWMLRSPFRTLMELGLWKLMLVSHLYWPCEEPLYEGLLAFATAYEKRKGKGRRQINAILSRVDMFGNVDLARLAREFLREIDAEQPPVEPSVIEPRVVEPNVVEPNVVEPSVVQASVVQPSVVQKVAPEPARAPVAAAPAAAEPPATPVRPKKNWTTQRSSRRIQINTRARIRRADDRIEIAVTLDASRDGLAFGSKQFYALGEQIYVAMHYRDGQEPIESPGRIVRVTLRGARSEYGVKLG